VALVDDSPKLVELYRAVLQMHGFNVVAVATSGEEIISAENRANLSNTDIAVIDYGMPGIDGLETASTIVKSHPSIRIIIATGNDSARTEALSVGFGFLKKPFTIDELLTQICS
jgi:DNA-binding response OmpR family regulator